MATGALLVVVVAPQTVVDPVWLLGMLVLAVATSFFKLSLRVSGGGATMTFGHAVGFLGLLTIGPHATALVVTAGIWTQCTYRLELKTPMDLRRKLFSMAVGVLTVEAAGLVFWAAGGVPGGPASAAIAAPLVAAALAYFFVNTGLVAGAVALDNRQAFVSVWHTNFLWSGPSYFVSAALVGCATVVVERGGLLIALLFAAPLVLTYLSYRAYLGRIADEQQQLRIARDHTQSVIHSMNEILVVVDPEGLITTTNAAACDLLGYEDGELVGRPFRDLVAANIPGGDEVIGHGSPELRHNVEMKLLTKQGEAIPVLFSSSLLASGLHGAEGVVCVALDIRERKRAELSRRAREERLQRQQAALAHLARDKHLHLGELEDAARLLTATAGRLMEASTTDLWLLKDQAALVSVDSYNLGLDRHSQRPVVRLDTAPGFAAALMKRRVITVNGSSGQPGWQLTGTRDDEPDLSVLHAPIRLGSVTVGVVTLSRVGAKAEWSIEEQHFAGSLADLASLAVEARDRRHAQEEVERAKDAAEAANRAKSAFVANMSHELRTPLNAILGYCELLQEEAPDIGAEAQVPDLQRIEKAGRHLLGLVNDVLDFSKIEAGRVTLHPEEFEAELVIREAASTAQSAANKNANTLTLEIDGALGTLYSDPQRLRQVLINLLGNACKFTEAGEILVRGQREQAAGEDWLVVEVHDTGIGMSDEAVDRLFREFSQADHSTTRRFGGTGLGLAISQRLCQLMGGSIEARSELGIGSVFTVRLPITAVPEQTRSAPSADTEAPITA